jgi:hypothetical protein
MSKDFRMQLEKVFDALGEIIAFVAVVIYALIILNGNFNFLPETVAKVFSVAWAWIGLLLIAVTGLECTIKRNIIIRLVFYVLLAVIIIFMFFPKTYDYLIGFVPTGA